MTSTRRTAIHAGHIIAHDGRGHRHLRDGVVVIEGGRILHVGPRFDGAVDETVNASDRVVTPGLISIGCTSTAASWWMAGACSAPTSRPS